MHEATKKYYEKRGQILIKNLRSRHFDAWYCPDRESALEKALELIPKGSKIGWGGSVSANEIGLIDAIRLGNYREIDRDKCSDPEKLRQLFKEALLADVFITGANALTLDGQMVNIDGNGNRVAPICYGPDTVIVVAGMNKVEDTLEAATVRARTVAAPMNKQRFGNVTPCEVTGTCADCKSEGCICNQIVITRNCKPAGRIKFIIVGDTLGF